MRKRIYIQFAVGIVLLVLVSQVTAQQEQWLQYHSSREAGQILGDAGSQTIQLSSEQPAGMKLPQFKGKSQLFGKWPTPMVKSERTTGGRMTYCISTQTLMVPSMMKPLSRHIERICEAHISDL
jgi:hypothetical protein